MSDLDVIKAREQAMPKRTREDTALEFGMSGPNIEENLIMLKFNLLQQWMCPPSNTGSHTSF